MSKLSYEDKINLYNDRKMGYSMTMLSKKYNIAIPGVQYLCRLIDKHGLDILRTEKNKYYPIYIKQEAIDRVLINNESVWSVALDIGLLSKGMLINWIKKYKENGYNIVERKRGRPTMPKVTKKKENETQEDKYKNIDELILAIDDYINYYNYDRIKVKLKGLSPVNYRLQSSN